MNFDKGDLITFIHGGGIGKEALFVCLHFQNSRSVQLRGPVAEDVIGVHVCCCFVLFWCSDFQVFSFSLFGDSNVSCLRNGSDDDDAHTRRKPSSEEFSTGEAEGEQILW